MRDKFATLDRSSMKSQVCITMLKALDDERRWGIIGALLKKPQTVGDLAERLEVSHYNVSKHIRVLRHAGIVVPERKGQCIHGRIKDSFCKQLSQYQTVLDLGCCTFRFDKVSREAALRL